MKIQITLLFALIYFNSFSQTIIKFDDIEKNKLSMKVLDSLYPNSIHTANEQGVFKGKKEKKFNKAWLNYYKELYDFCKEKNLMWADTVFCFNKIYFNANGKVEYWFYQFNKKDKIPEEKQNQYLSLLKEFVVTHKIKIKAKSKFSQCSSVYFFDF